MQEMLLGLGKIHLARALIYTFVLFLSVTSRAAVQRSCQGQLEVIPKGNTVILAANRLPLTVRIENGQIVKGEAFGGLVAALKSTSEQFAWLGWSGFEVTPEFQLPVREYLAQIDDRFALRPLFMSEEEKNGFYNDFANRVIWPAFHGLRGLVAQDFPGFDHYAAVNRRFAEQLSEMVEDEIKRSDNQILVWVHDYQLMMVPRFLDEILKRRGTRDRVRIGFFLHIPFPSSVDSHQIPKNYWNSLMAGLDNADQVSFQTPRDAENFASARRFEQLPDSPICVNPVGIDPLKLKRQIERPEIDAKIVALRNRYNGYHLYLGIERLDPIKGVKEKLEAYRVFLRRNPHRRDTAVLLQAMQPSRMDIPEYRNLQSTIRNLAAEINREFPRSAGREPAVILDEAGIPNADVLAHMAVSDSVVINSLRDGMNLVAFEHEIIQETRAYPGVMILSKETGASHWLEGALTVDPLNTSELADAFEQALNLSLEQRRSRNTLNLRHINHHTSRQWMRDCLMGLSGTNSATD